ncbi:oxidoreductase [Amycolatopsis sp. K13G38]|uniref:Oxidoreductase n=1 Tax=Amycolatopsis acididurans TaxID=2724524 RepID=A0ABX1JI03_9PSEU|nr:NAD(P)-dependent oxidoreductase [Amycolatopsis acididurans]NKQ58030.1 oxidoreductase [Amycolatopsis acididurans]
MTRDRKKILCSAGMPELVATRLAAFGDVVPVADDELAAQAGECIAVAARASTRVSSAIIEAAPALRVIGRSGVGVDNVDVAAASGRGIPVVITPGATTAGVAEGAIALVLALAKRLPTLDHAVKGGTWATRDTADILDLAGSTLGVVGLGRVGRHVSRLALALGFTVLGHDPFPSPEIPDGMPLLDLTALLARCDVVVLAAALTGRSRAMIDAGILRNCRPGLVLVNVGRGELVSSLDDLHQALQAGRLGGVGLDVFPREPPETSHPLFRDERVLASPHALAFTRQGRVAIFEEMAEGMAEVLSGRRARHVADPAVYESRKGAVPS